MSIEESKEVAANIPTRTVSAPMDRRNEASTAWRVFGLRIGLAVPRGSCTLRVRMAMERR